MSATRSPARILVFVPVEFVGGHERMLLAWLARAVQLGVLQPTIHCGHNPRLLEWCHAAGLSDVVATTFDLSSRGKFSRLVNAIRLYRIARRSASDQPVLIAPGSIQSATWFTLAAVFASPQTIMYVPMVFGARTMGFRFPALRDWITRWVSRRIGGWITISAEQKKLLQGLWPLAAPVRVVHNVNALPPSRYSLPRRLQSTPYLRLLFVGRFDVHQKGLDWLLGFFLRHPRHLRECRLTLLGAAGEVGEVTEWAQRLNYLEPGFATILDWQDPAQAYEGADALILASRFEGLPLVALEAIGCGLVVLASKQSGLDAIVPNGATYEFGSDHDLSEVLDCFADHTVRAETLKIESEAVQIYLNDSRRDMAIEAVASLVKRMCQGG